MATAASTPASTAGGGGGGDSSVDVGIGAGNAGGGGGDADAGYPYSFNNQNHARLLKRPGSVDGQAFELGFLLHCDVLVLDYTAQVTADYLQHCRVFIGPCEGSVFIRDCKDCHFTVACKQFRALNCENCVVHLYSKTDPVIETSHHMVFAPYNGAYAKQDMHFAVAGLETEDTHWRTVHDFNERDTSVEQPHWSLIDYSTWTNADNSLTPAGMVAVARAFDRFDEDGDGALNLEEFNAYQVATGASDEVLPSHEAMIEAFREFNVDLDKNGFLTYSGFATLYATLGGDELKRACAAIGIDPATEDWKVELTSSTGEWLGAPTNPVRRDATAKTVSDRGHALDGVTFAATSTASAALAVDQYAADVEAALQSGSTLSPPVVAGLVEAFNRFDADQDGALSVQEFNTLQTALGSLDELLPSNAALRDAFGDVGIETTADGFLPLAGFLQLYDKLGEGEATRVIETLGIDTTGGNVAQQGSSQGQDSDAAIGAAGLERVCELLRLAHERGVVLRQWFAAASAASPALPEGFVTAADFERGLTGLALGVGVGGGNSEELATSALQQDVLRAVCRVLDTRGDGSVDLNSLVYTALSSGSPSPSPAAAGRGGAGAGAGAGASGGSSSQAAGKPQRDRLMVSAVRPSLAQPRAPPTPPPQTAQSQQGKQQAKRARRRVMAAQRTAAPRGMRQVIEDVQALLRTPDKYVRLRRWLGWETWEEEQSALDQEHAANIRRQRRKVTREAAAATAAAASGEPRKGEDGDGSDAGGASAGAGVGAGISSSAVPPPPPPPPPSAPDAPVPPRARDAGPIIHSELLYRTFVHLGLRLPPHIVVAFMLQAGAQALQRPAGASMVASTASGASGGQPGADASEAPPIAATMRLPALAKYLSGLRHARPRGEAPAMSRHEWLEEKERLKKQKFDSNVIALQNLLAGHSGAKLSDAVLEELLTEYDVLPDWVVESEARENTTAWLGTHPGEKAVKSKALALQRKHPKLSWPAATAQAQRIVKKERVATEKTAIESGPAVSVAILKEFIKDRKAGNASEGLKFDAWLLARAKKRKAKSKSVRGWMREKKAAASAAEKAASQLAPVEELEKQVKDLFSRTCVEHNAGAGMKVCSSTKAGVQLHKCLARLRAAAARDAHALAVVVGPDGSASGSGGGAGAGAGVDVDGFEDVEEDEVGGGNADAAAEDGGKDSDQRPQIGTLVSRAVFQKELEEVLATLSTDAAVGRSAQALLLAPDEAAQRQLAALLKTSSGKRRCRRAAAAIAAQREQEGKAPLSETALERKAQAALRRELREEAQSDAVSFEDAQKAAQTAKQVEAQKEHSSSSSFADWMRNKAKQERDQKKARRQAARAARRAKKAKKTEAQDAYDAWLEHSTKKKYYSLAAGKVLRKPKIKKPKDRPKWHHITDPVIPQY